MANLKSDKNFPEVIRFLLVYWSIDIFIETRGTFDHDDRFEKLDDSLMCVKTEVY